MRQRPAPIVVLHVEIPVALDTDLERFREERGGEVGAPLSRSAVARIVLRAGLAAIDRERARPASHPEGSH